MSSWGRYTWRGTPLKLRGRQGRVRRWLHIFFKGWADD